ncbi:polysaccharide pyruvyl transferase family protein [Hydrogenophaga sp.]|uniref:polysaccharide pyruvyl transferase family protein n=1 Tax=Hydrogenophaga sp. TaxID=1904254 RepID=UPI003D0B9842
MIRLYWYNKKPNFGDQLSPVLCRMLSGQDVEYTGNFELCDLVAIGSVLEHLSNSAFSGIVWGAGFIAKNSNFELKSRPSFRAVRGELTAKRLALGKEVVLGDPGLLAHILAPNVRQSTELGIIPHFVDNKNKKISWIAANRDNVKLIDIQAGIDFVIKEVSDCRYIVASCLHGLILADALGIPNAWVRLSDKVIGDGFKFRDYYSVYGIHDPKPIPLRWWDSAKSIKKKIGSCRRPNVVSLQQRLRESFPYLNV